MKEYYMRTLTSADSFKFWGGAKDTVSLLTRDELEMIFDQVMEEYFETSTPTETEINDFFWFNTDTIAEMLGYLNFDVMYDDRTAEKEISLDNGRTFETASMIDSDILESKWGLIRFAMEEKTVDAVLENNPELDMQNKREFLTAYLKESPVNLIIG